MSIRKLLAPLLGLLVTVSVLLVPASPARADAASHESMLANARLIARVFDGHNSYRASQGLPPLKFSPYISENVSQPWSITQGSIGEMKHNDDFKWDGAWLSAENVAYSGMGGDVAGDMVKMWVDSKGHRDNMLGSWSVVSIGMYRTPAGVVFGTVNFYDSHVKNTGQLYSSGAQWLATLGALPPEPAPAGPVVIVVGDNPTPKPSPRPAVTTTKPAPVAPKPVVTTKAPAPNPVTTTKAPAKPKVVDVYSTPGYHTVNGRNWYTRSERYSGNIVRHWNYIWGKYVIAQGNRFVVKEGWKFNTLTYTEGTKAEWGRHRLANPGKFLDTDGTQWRTECDTSYTGRGACMSWRYQRVIVDLPGGGYGWQYKWFVNNIVRFKK